MLWLLIFPFFRKKWRAKTNWPRAFWAWPKTLSCASTNEPKKFWKYGRWRRYAAGPLHQTLSRSISATIRISTIQFRRLKANKSLSWLPATSTLSSKRFCSCRLWQLKSDRIQIHLSFSLLYRNKPRIILVSKEMKDPTLWRTAFLHSSKNSILICGMGWKKFEIFFFPFVQSDNSPTYCRVRHKERQSPNGIRGQTGHCSSCWW